MRGHSVQGRSCVGVNDLTIVHVYNMLWFNGGGGGGQGEKGRRGEGGVFSHAVSQAYERERACDACCGSLPPSRSIRPPK